MSLIVPPWETSPSRLCREWHHSIHEGKLLCRLICKRLREIDEKVIGWRITPRPWAASPCVPPLLRVTVTASNQTIGASRTTVSSTNGSYAINGLRPGLYDVSLLPAGRWDVVEEGPKT